MKKMYVEIIMTDEQSFKLQKWENDNNKDSEDLAQKLLLKFIDSLGV